MAHACADELEEGQEIWQQAVDAGCDQELLRDPKGEPLLTSLSSAPTPLLTSPLLMALVVSSSPAEDGTLGLHRACADVATVNDRNLEAAADTPAAVAEE